MLGYILVPVIIIAIFGASLFSSLLFLKGMLASPGVEIFSPATQPLDKTGEPSDVVRPSNFHELLGTWSGREIGGSQGWTFSFSDGYNVHAVSPEGHSYSGKVGIHWRLGGDDRGLQVPPGAGVFDVDVTESSSMEIVGKTSVGAFSIYSGNLLKLCSGEPGKTKRPESFDPVPGIKCFELSKTAEASSAQISPSPGMSQSLPQADSEAAEDDETRAARIVFKQFTAAYQAGNMPVAKSYFSQTTLGEMERSGQVDMAMGMISGTNIDEFSALREENKITFSQSSKQGEATMSMFFHYGQGKWRLEAWKLTLTFSSASFFQDPDYFPDLFFSFIRL